LSCDHHLSLAGICADFARREARLARRAAAAGLSRREFPQMLAAGAAAATGASAWPRGASAAAAAETLPRSRVVLVTHPEVLLKEYRVNPPIVRQMLDRALVELTGKRTEAEAWQAVGREDDFVAIKHNSIGAPTLHSHTEINDAVSAQLAAGAKVKPERILVVDRDIPAPYNEVSPPFTLPTRGLKTHLRRLYTDQATAIVNVTVLKAHFGDGLSEAMKNHLGSVNNPGAFHGWEPDHLPHSLPELNALEPLRRKTRLVIIDAIRPLFAGGPADNPDYRWDYRGLIVATDPVAASAVGLRILEEKRAAVRGKEWPMTAARQMMAYAQSIGLGNAAADRIDLVRANLG
jgi:hypothetical protein